MTTGLGLGSVRRCNWGSPPLRAIHRDQDLPAGGGALERGDRDNGNPDYPSHASGSRPRSAASAAVVVSPGHGWWNALCRAPAAGRGLTTAATAFGGRSDLDDPVGNWSRGRC